MKNKIKKAKIKIGRKYEEISDKTASINNIEVSLSNGGTFDIQIDDDGDIMIISSGICKVVCEDANVVILRVKKNC